MDDVALRWQQQTSCLSPRLSAVAAVAPSGIGSGKAFVVMGGAGYFSSNDASEVGLWDTSKGTFQRLAIQVRLSCTFPPRLSRCTLALFVSCRVGGYCL